MAGAVLVTLSPESPEQGRRRATPNKTQTQNGSGGVMRHPEVLLFTCQVIKACGEWDKSLANSLWLAQSFNLRTASSFSNRRASSRASPSILFYFALVDERKKNFNFISRAPRGLICRLEVVHFLHLGGNADDKLLEGLSALIRWNKNGILTEFTMS